MKKTILTFLCGNMCFVSAFAETFLKATNFPKTFEDLSFKSRIEVLRDGYKPFEVKYDDNGVCISGCAYRGITIQEDMVAVDEANEEIENLIANEKSEQTIDSSHSGKNYISSCPDWCKNGLSTKLPLRYPVDMTNFKHPITSDFGFRKIEKGFKFHPALDVGIPNGTPVYATADGVVESVGYDSYGGGNYINIKHDNGLITQYLHLSQQLVVKGQKVSACQQIALSGNTGTSTGPHLDYRIRFDSNRNKYVDILCPRKSGDRSSKTSVNTNMPVINEEHSLFHAPYKFRYQSDKSAQWRINNGHCMSSIYDLLPDEAQ